MKSTNNTSIYKSFSPFKTVTVNGSSIFWDAAGIKWNMSIIAAQIFSSYNALA